MERSAILYHNSLIVIVFFSMVSGSYASIAFLAKFCLKACIIADAAGGSYSA